MNEKENLDIRKVLGTIIGIFLFSGIVLFFTYAWYEWRSENTNVAMTIRDIVIEFENEGNVSVDNIGPVLNIQDGVKSGFSVTNQGNGDTSFYVHLDITSISDNLLTDSFKYALVRDVSGGTDYDYENPVVMGDFSEFHLGTNVISSNETIEGIPEDSTDIEEIKYTYQFIVYIDGTVLNDLSLQANSMEATLVISDVYRGYLNGVEPGSYVAYTGNSGCPDGHCDGTNANYVDDANMGYCVSSASQFTVNGWRVAYVEGDTAYLVSAGATECVRSLSPEGDHRKSTSATSYTSEATFNSYFYATGYTYNETTAQYTLTGLSTSALVWADSYSDIISTYKYTCKSSTSTTVSCYDLYEIASSSTSTKTLWYRRAGYANAEEHIKILDEIALTYCNTEFAYGGVCGVHNSWGLDGDDYQLILKSKEVTTDLETCYGTSSEDCGLNYDLLDIGSYYWFAEKTGNIYYPAYAWYTSSKSVTKIRTNSVLGVRPVLRLSSSVLVTGGTGTYEDPYTIVNESESIPYLSNVAAGAYVSYEGDNGCPEGHCDGTNANYVDESSMGYCSNSSYKFDVTGWRVAYQKNDTPYLISAGSPECLNVLSSDGDHVTNSSPVYFTNEVTFGAYYYGTGYTYNATLGRYTLTGLSSSTLDWASNYESIISTYKYTCRLSTTTTTCYQLYEIASSSSSSYTTFYKRNSYATEEEYLSGLNSAALTYCNATYAYNGVCDGNSAWNISDEDYQLLLQNVDFSNTLSSCNASKTEACGIYYDLIANGGYYWFAKYSSSSGYGWNASVPRIGLFITNYAFGLRPVLRLSSSVIVKSGLGIEDDPYIIDVYSG